jgi:hypothetical protein
VTKGLRNKGLSGNLKNTEEVLSLNQEENNTQDATDEKNANMKKTRSSPPPAIPTKKRFEVLQPQETNLSQRQDHPQSIATNKPRIQNTIVEIIRKKNEEMRNKARKKTTSLVGTSHIRDKTNDTRIISPTATPRKPTIPQEQPTQPVKQKDQPHRQSHRGNRRHTFHESVAFLDKKIKGE